MPLLACLALQDQASVEVIESFGKFSRIAYPGFNVVWCCIGERVAGGLSLRIQQLDVRWAVQLRLLLQPSGRLHARQMSILGHTTITGSITCPQLH